MSRDVTSFFLRIAIVCSLPRVSGKGRKKIKMNFLVTYCFLQKEYLVNISLENVATSCAVNIVFLLDRVRSLVILVSRLSSNWIERQKQISSSEEFWGILSPERKLVKYVFRNISPILRHCCRIAFVSNLLRTSGTKNKNMEMYFFFPRIISIIKKM
jgi:hypothetical protein